MTTHQASHVAVLEAMLSENERVQSTFPNGDWWQAECDALRAAIAALTASPQAAPDAMRDALRAYLTAQRRMLDRWADGDENVKRDLWRNLHACEAAAEAALASPQAAPEDTHAFKNFHRLLCERFDYAHDEIDWRRDQCSLIEHIARRLVSPQVQGGEAVAWQWRWADNGNLWFYITKDAYEQMRAMPEYETRALYATPQRAPGVGEA